MVVRDAVLAEGVPGGFAGLYPIFSAMEDAGRVRRGYFVEGLGGSQFAHAGAIDRLRSGSRPGGPLMLGAGDPANPYGAALPWPGHEAGRPNRSAGAAVILIDGSLAAFVERGGRRMLAFPGADLASVAACISDRTEGGGRRQTVATIDGRPAQETALGKALLETGFVVSYKGLTRRRDRQIGRSAANGLRHATSQGLSRAQPRRAARPTFIRRMTPGSASNSAKYRIARLVLRWVMNHGGLGN